jgi:hypothetical protein
MVKNRGRGLVTFHLSLNFPLAGMGHVAVALPVGMKTIAWFRK